MSSFSVYKDLVKAIPDDMPDMATATSHLQPLDLPGQIVFYVKGAEQRLGITVSCFYRHRKVLFDF